MEDDDTASALASLRSLSAQRTADDASERAAVAAAPVDRVDLALSILGEQRRWNIDDRRALGLPRYADEGDWLSCVALCIGESDPAMVIERWLATVEEATGRHTFGVVIDALGRLPGLAPVVSPVGEALRTASAPVRRLLRDALIASTVPVDGPALALLRDILRDPGTTREIATDAILVAGMFARRTPVAAGLIAARARADRRQRRADAHSPLPLDRAVAEARAVSGLDLAEAVAASRCSALAPTAMLELENETSPLFLATWARALVNIAEEVGIQHLARIRGRPGRSALIDSTSPLVANTLDGLTSPIADERRKALDALAGSPNAEFLQAFLLAAELDRYITRRLERASWRSLDATSWLPLLSMLSREWKQVDDVIACVAPGTHLVRDQLAVLRANQLLEQLLDRGAARATMATRQELTPALSVLLSDGVQSFAPRAWTPPLAPEEIAELEAAEAELADSALSGLL